MMNIQVFNFKNNNVRVEMMNGAPLFCLPDVADALNIKNANPSRFNMNSDGVHKMYSADSLGRKNEITFVNEPNLYRVIFRSNKKEAVAFQNWVFEEVLPTIRKTGNYTLTINDEQQRLIQESVQRKVNRTGMTYQAVYHELKTRYKVPRYDRLPASKFKDCIAWLNDGFGTVDTSELDVEQLQKMYAIGEKKVDEINHALSVAHKAICQLEHGLKTLDTSLVIIKTHNATNHSVFETLKHTTSEIEAI